jgi:hypothetical protein
MSDASHAPRSLRERLGESTEERLGRALSDLLENPLLSGAIGRAFDAREKAVQAQEVAMGALNLPSAADIERLTRRLRSVSNRLEGIEDGVDRLDRAMTPARGGGAEVEIDQRLSAIETQLARLSEKLDGDGASSATKPRAPSAKTKTQGATKSKVSSAANPKAPSAAKPKASSAGKSKTPPTKPKPTGVKAKASAARPGKA